jgi:methionyl aminopeptidase
LISIKNQTEIENLREGGKILSAVLSEISNMVKPGVTTSHLDSVAYDLIKKNGAKPAFLGYNDYPYSICTSINSQLVHGLPSKIPLVEGDILSIDLGVFYKGLNTDSAITLPVGKINQQKSKLIKVTQQSFFEGLKTIKAGARLGDLSYAIQSFVEKNGFSVVRDLVGHGIGRQLHEEPQIPNFGLPNQGPVLKSGMVLAIEPMVSAGSWEIEIASDLWTVVMADNSMSSHFEHTVLVTDEGYEILTLA